MDPTITDEDLMARYVRGDSSAFDALFERYAPRLLRTIRRQIDSEDDARELVQQSFLQLHRARHDFEEGRLLRPWLFTICFNLRREHFRRRARRPEAPLELDGRTDPALLQPDLLRKETALAVRAAVAALPRGQREVIELHWFAELPFRDVAAIVGASVTAVKVRAHRGYTRLREALADVPPKEARNPRARRVILESK